MALSLRMLALLGCVLVGGGAWIVPTLQDTPGRPPPARGEAAVTAVRTAGAIPTALHHAMTTLPGVAAVVPVSEQQVLVETITAAPDGPQIQGWSRGWAQPIDLLGTEPRSYAELLPPGRDRDAVAALRPGEVLLGATEAMLLGAEAMLLGAEAMLLGAEATLHGVPSGAELRLLAGPLLRVVGVVADELVNAAGGLTHSATFAELAPRFLLVAHGPGIGPREAVAEAASEAGGHVRHLGAAPWWRTWREVTPLARLKASFGGLAVAPAPGRHVRVDPAWEAEAITTRTVPLLGEVTCHRAILDDLERALDRVVAAGLAATIHPGDYAGCYSPRAQYPGGPLSRHAFGIALDLNASTNGLGSVPTLDPRVVAIFEQEGFWWGGRWPRPDGMHMEHRGWASTIDGSGSS